jgi:hypothetical protein
MYYLLLMNGNLKSKDLSMYCIQQTQSQLLKYSERAIMSGISLGAKSKTFGSINCTRVRTLIKCSTWVTSTRFHNCEENLIYCDLGLNTIMLLGFLVLSADPKLCWVHIADSVRKFDNLVWHFTDWLAFCVVDVQYEMSVSMWTQCSNRLWSVVVERLGRRTLNQRVVGSNPGEGTARYLWARYLKIHSSG